MTKKDYIEREEDRTMAEDEMGLMIEDADDFLAEAQQAIWDDRTHYDDAVVTEALVTIARSRLEIQSESSGHTPRAEFEPLPTLEAWYQHCSEARHPLHVPIDNGWGEPYSPTRLYATFELGRGPYTGCIVCTFPRCNWHSSKIERRELQGKANDTQERGWR